MRYYRWYYIAVILSSVMSFFLIQCNEEPPVESVNHIPEIIHLIADPQRFDWEEIGILSVVAEDPDGDNLHYSWTCSGGVILSATDNDSITWQAPKADGSIYYSVTVSDNDTSVTRQDTLQVGAQPVIMLNQTGLDFGNLDSVRTFTITNSGSGELTYTISKTADWLVLGSTAGSLVENGKNGYILKTAAASEEITVTIDRRGLENGSYTDQLNITSNGGNATIAVTMDVIPELSVSPLLLEFGSETDTLTFNITNTGSGSLNWSLSESALWLTADPMSGHISKEAVVTVTVDRTGLENGYYAHQISIDSDGGTAVIGVSMGISSPILAVSEAVLDFGAGSSELDFVISNTGVDTLNWNLSKTADWLNIDPASGSLTTEERTISVTVDRTGLDSGTYQDQISIDSNGGSRLVSVSMVVGNPVLSVDMTSLDFGSVANSLNFQIENIGAGSLDWEISESVEWLTVNPASGSSTEEIDEIIVTVDRTGYDTGTYSGRIDITSNGGDISLDVSMEVAAPLLVIDVTQLDFGAVNEDTTFNISNAGAGTLTWEAEKTADWLVIDPNTGSTTDEADEITVTVNRAGQAAGVYTDQINVTSNGGDQTIDVQMEVQGKPVVGIWEGEYSGYDPQTKENIIVRRRLRINLNSTYSDTLWGFPETQSEIIFQWETGQWDLSADESVIYFHAIEAQRININNNTLEDWDRGSHEDDVLLNEDFTEWHFTDDNLDVEYTLQKQSE